MLDRQKANRIKFRAEPMEKRSSQSKEEELELRKGEAKYQEFMHEHLQDPDIEKGLDNIIEEQMKKGKDDNDILSHLGSVVGIGK